MFKNAYIPKRLNEVVDFERDINQAKAGIGEDLVYKTLIGLKADLSGTVQQPEILDKSSDEASESDCEEEEEKGSKFIHAGRPKEETAEEKKARKQAVKQEKSEKRKVKIKKHVKKRLETKGKR